MTLTHYKLGKEILPGKSNHQNQIPNQNKNGNGDFWTHPIDITGKNFFLAVGKDLAEGINTNSEYKTNEYSTLFNYYQQSLKKLLNRLRI